MDPSPGCHQQGAKGIPGLAGWLGGRCLQEVEKRLTELATCSFPLKASPLTKNSQARRAEGSGWRQGPASIVLRGTGHSSHWPMGLGKW